MRNYEPIDDGQGPTDFDEYVDYPAQTHKDIAARFTLHMSVIPSAPLVCWSGRMPRSWTFFAGRPVDQSQAPEPTRRTDGGPPSCPAPW